MGVTADDEWDTESIEYGQQPIFARQPSEQVVFVARRRMTKQHLAQPDNFGSTRHRPSGQQPLERWVGLLRLPANDGLGIGWDGAIPGWLRRKIRFIPRLRCQVDPMNHGQLLGVGRRRDNVTSLPAEIVDDVRLEHRPR